MSVGVYPSLGYLWYVPVPLKMFIHFVTGTVEIFPNRPSLLKETVLTYYNSSDILVHVRHRPDIHAYSTYTHEDS